MMHLQKNKLNVKKNKCKKIKFKKKINVKTYFLLFIVVDILYFFMNHPYHHPIFALEV